MKCGPYVLVVAPPDFPGKKYKGRYCYEHRLIFWQTNGYLPENVHHENQIKTCNEPNNLIGMTWTDHAILHKEIDWINLECSWCAEIFKMRPSNYRAKLKGGQTRFCCCHSHAMKLQHKLGLVNKNFLRGPEHGILIRYAQGCRCAECKEAHRIGCSKYRNKKRLKNCTVA